jgi:hypothetical protein
MKARITEASIATKEIKKSATLSERIGLYYKKSKYLSFQPLLPKLHTNNSS